MNEEHLRLLQQLQYHQQYGYTHKCNSEHLYKLNYMSIIMNKRTKTTCSGTFRIAIMKTVISCNKNNVKYYCVVYLYILSPHMVTKLVEILRGLLAVQL